MSDKRIAVTLTNGRSHVLDLPDEISAADAAAVIRGERPGSEIGWEQGDGDWLPFGTGFGWVSKSAVAEISLVEYTADEEVYVELPYRGG
jgi:hypothetical protein